MPPIEDCPMPHSSDDPPSRPPAEGARTGRRAPASRAMPLADPSEVLGADSGAPGATATDETAPKRRRRRRRRRPPPQLDPAPEGGEARAAAEPPAPVENGQSAVPEAGQPARPHRRRRRRRGPSRDAGVAPETASADGGGEASAAADEPMQNGEEPRSAPGNADPHERPRRSRRRRPRAEHTTGENQQGSAADAGAAFRQDARMPRRSEAARMRDRRRPAEAREGGARNRRWRRASRTENRSGSRHPGSG